MRQNAAGCKNEAQLSSQAEFAPKLSPDEFRERARILMELDIASFKANWHVLLPLFAYDVVGGFVFGVALSLAFFVYALSVLASV